ncbi:MAG TPA: class I SAM-dependent methyltransferase [Bryobacteraceae bacterium]|nr:class I SAM-dependent methyltransferase [Bryobacteraceae bacterium]
MNEWWGDFFDADYIRIWSGFFPPERTTAEVDGLWQLLGLHEGSRVLDAPCGYGRLSRPLAERNAIVLGVDQSQALLKHAESERGSLPADRLRYLHHDLRQPLPEGGFDAAFNVFSSLGYRTEEDDLAILRNLRAAVRPGGLVLVETVHRDLVIVNFLRGAKPSQRMADGTLVVEEPVFDPIAGCVNFCWYWWGPSGKGEKSGSMRTYSATELIALMKQAGLCFRSAHRGCSAEPFKAEGPDMGGRLAILSERE